MRSPASSVRNSRTSMRSRRTFDSAESTAGSVTARSISEHGSHDDTEVSTRTLSPARAADDVWLISWARSAPADGWSSTTEPRAGYPVELTTAGAGASGSGGACAAGTGVVADIEYATMPTHPMKMVEPIDPRMIPAVANPPPRAERPDARMSRC